MTSEFNVREFGAKGDGVGMDTKAIQAAIDACTKNGGGSVVFPAGTYVTGTIFVKDNVTLYFGPQAVLLASKNLEDYPVVNVPAYDIDAPGMNKCLIYAENAYNIALAGPGIIDGQARFFPCGTEGYNVEDVSASKDSQQHERPVILRFARCKNISITDLTIQNAAAYCTAYLWCDNIKINGVKVNNRANETCDAFSFGACQNVSVSNCNLSCSDDCIFIFTSARNFVITNCVISSRWSAFRIGVLSSGTIKDIAVSNCVIYNTYGCPIKMQMVEGGVMENICFNNIIMDNVTGPISMRLAGWRGWRTGQEQLPPIGKLRNIRFNNIRAVVVANSKPSDVEVRQMPGELRSCINITGLGGHNIEGISFSNIHITYAGGGTAEEAARRDIPEKEIDYPEYHMFGTLPAYGLYARHVKGLTLNNVRFDLAAPDLRPAVVCDDVEDLEMTGFSASGSSQAESLIRLRQSREVFLHGSRPLGDIGTFVRIEGENSRNITLCSNDLHQAKTAIETADGAKSDTVHQHRPK